MLVDYWDRDKLALGERDVELARDAYDDCIAALDRRVGELLDELDRREVLRDTLVIITSDHGEQFGEHGVFNHGFSLYTQEVHVPLLIISAASPAGGTRSPSPSACATCRPPWSTWSDSGTARPSPAARWRNTGGRAAGERRNASPAFSEVDIPIVIIPQRGRGPNQRGFTMSLVAEGLHYLLDIRGTEELYDVAADPREVRDLKKVPERTTDPEPVAQRDGPDPPRQPRHRRSGRRVSETAHDGARVDAPTHTRSRESS